MSLHAHSLRKLQLLEDENEALNAELVDLREAHQQQLLHDVQQQDSQQHDAQHDAQQPEREEQPHQQQDAPQRGGNLKKLAEIIVAYWQADWAGVERQLKAAWKQSENVQRACKSAKGSGRGSGSASSTRG